MTAIDPTTRSLWWRQKLNRRLIGVFTVRILGIFALFAFEVSVAKSLGVEGYGLFSFLLSTAVIVSRFASLGWFNSLTRRMTVYLTFDNLGLCKGSVFTGYLTTMIGLGLGAALLGLIAVNVEFLTATQAFAIVLPLAAALVVLELNRYALRGLDAGDIGELFPFLLLPAVAATVFWLLSVGDSATALFIYMVIVWSLVLASTISILRRLPKGFWSTKSEYRVREWTVSALAMLVGSVSTELAARMAVLLLGALGKDADAGLFQAAARLSLMTIFILRVLTPVAAPRISVLFHRGKFSELRKYYLRQSMLAFLGALPFALIFWFLPEFVLAFFGEGFEEAAPVLRVLAVGYLIAAAAGPCGTSLLMIGQERRYGIVTTVSTLAMGITCYPLALHFGGIGAAFATAGGLIATNVLCVVIFYRSIAGHPEPSDTSGAS